MTQGAAPPPGQVNGTGFAWVDAAVRIVTQVGFPVVAAGILLYFVLFRVDGAMKVIQDNEDARTRMVSAMQDSLVAALDRQTDRFDKAIDRNIEVNRSLTDRITRYYDKKDAADK